MSEDERARWDARYRARGPALAEAAGVLAAQAAHLPATGRALDVGGGAGRNALWLARRGLDVTVVDISEEGLALARAAAAREGLALTTVCRDLEREAPPPGPFQVVLSFHYLNRALFPRFPELLAPGGVLVFVQPTRRNLERHPHPSARFLLDEGELASLGVGLEVLHLAEGWSAEGRHEAELVARRP